MWELPISGMRSHGFDSHIYVVGNEQNYHFQVLAIVLKKLGFPWADKLYHLSYGMVELPEGKMKSREGTVVDADDLMDEMEDNCQTDVRRAGQTGGVYGEEEKKQDLPAGGNGSTEIFYSESGSKEKHDL